MSLLPDAFNAIADTRLWFNVQSGAPLLMSDLPEFIPLRFNDFKNNWEFIKEQLRLKVDLYISPDTLEQQIAEMSKFLDTKRNQSINPFNSTTIFIQFYAIWDNSEIDSLALTKTEQAVVNSNTTRVSSFIRNDFLDLRTRIRAARDELADETGGTDADYNRIFNRSAVPTLRDIGVKDIAVMEQLQLGIQTLDFILANSGSLDTISIDPFALAKINANNPNLEIASHQSGSLVQMNLGDDLQKLAARHLGDPDRWIEIAIANGLKPPYIDEIGELITLITNGSGSQINIAALDTNGAANIEKVYANQIIFLRSDVESFPEQRTIIDVREIPVSGEIVLELDGEDDLDKYKVSENATMRVYKPNTINSNFLIMIPNTSPPTNLLPEGQIPFFLRTAADDEKRAGVDVRLTEDFDLTFTSTGDLQLSFGLANAIQAVQLKLLNEQGQLSRHPAFGLVSVTGASISQADLAQQALTESISDMISTDSRFSRIEQLRVNRLQGGASGFTVDLVVRMAGTGSLVPLSFEITPFV